MSTFSLTCTEEHEAALRAALFETAGVEGAAYILFKEVRISADPWDRRAHTKLLVREIIPIVPVSASAMHVTWDTKTFVTLLQRSQKEELVIGIAHSHTGTLEDFSSQDNDNEAELFRTVATRNGAEAKLVSMLFSAKGHIRARIWQYPKHKTMARAVTVIGERIQIHKPDRPAPAAPAFARQVLAFGPALIDQLKGLRVAVVGAGGTGSATAPLLARAGVGQLAIIDDDIVEVTNLNRLHGATQADADAMRAKADVVAISIAAMGLGTRVLPLRGWVNAPQVRDALKASVSSAVGN